MKRFQMIFLILLFVGGLVGCQSKSTDNTQNQVKEDDKKVEFHFNKDEKKLEIETDKADVTLE